MLVHPIRIALTFESKLHPVALAFIAPAARVRLRAEMRILPAGLVMYPETAKFAYALAARVVAIVESIAVVPSHRTAMKLADAVVSTQVIVPDANHVPDVPWAIVGPTVYDAFVSATSAAIALVIFDMPLSWLGETAPLMSLKSGWLAAGTPLVEIDVSQLDATAALDCTPPSVDALGFGNLPAGNVPVPKSLALPLVATVASPLTVPLNAAFSAIMVPVKVGPAERATAPAPVVPSAMSLMLPLVAIAERPKAIFWAATVAAIRRAFPAVVASEIRADVRVLSVARAPSPVTSDTFGCAKVGDPEPLIPVWNWCDGALADFTPPNVVGVGSGIVPPPPPPPPLDRPAVQVVRARS
jgi:hypothetical protein